MDISPDEALKRLKDGNQRFLETLKNSENSEITTKPYKLVLQQSPFATILGCSDSRVPAEIVFDQGLGDLFVIRVAGNIVSPSQIGSAEFAVSQLKTNLIVVLGHTNCGAIMATIDALRDTVKKSNNLLSIVNRIRPIVENLMDPVTPMNEKELLQKATQINIKNSVNQLKNSSSLLEDKVLDHEIKIVGAEYSIQTGEVMFFDH